MPFWKPSSGVPRDPFRQPRKPLWLPAAMREAPALKRPLHPGPVRPRHALLINPFYPKSPRGSFGKHVLTPTLALTSVAGATPADWTVRCWDENLLQGPPPVEPVPEVVGITVHLTFARRAYALAAHYRKLGSRVVLGGLHVQACPGEAAPHADALAIGEGVQLWPRILRDAEANQLRARYEVDFSADYDREPPPRRELLPWRSFLTTTSAIATRGCRNRCGFCYLATRGLRMPRQTRHPADVRRQIAADGQPYAVFTDNNLGADPAYLRRLCRELRPLNRIWSAAVTLDVTADPALVREMALAGCTGVFVGFETLSHANLRRAGKRAADPRHYTRGVRVFHDHGIQVNGSFVFGFDEDGPEVFAETVGWIETNRLECATFHLLTPYPGTPLFRRLEAEGRLLHRNWDLYDTAHVVFRPNRMTAEQLLLGYDWAYRRLFSLGSIWRRRPTGATAALSHLASSLLYKKSNRLWCFLIRHRLVHAAWRPLVELTRWRHVAFRRRLARETSSQPASIPTPFPAGV